MKLVDILARDLKVWPAGVKIITQQQSGYLFDEANYPLDILLREADDCFNASVPRAQWQSAVDALNTENCAHLWVGWSDTEACELCNKTRKIVVEWNGDGLPPVGTVCEYKMALAGWVGATITAVTEKSIVFTRPLFKDRTGLDYENTHEEILPLHAAKRFRPIRTPDQIAAEERMNSAKIFHGLVCPEGKWHKVDDAAREAWAAIYDAGYRKFEIVDN